MSSILFGLAPPFMGARRSKQTRLGDCYIAKDP